MKKILFPTLLITTLLAGGAVAFAIWHSSPATPEDLVKEARKSYEEKDYATATIHLLRAVQQDPKDREARFLLVDTYVSQNDLRSAARQLQSFLEYVPEDRDASLKLGSLYLRGDQNAYEEIRKITEMLLKKDPMDVAALILQGNYNAGMRKLPDSKEDFEKATEIEPNNRSALLGLGATQAMQQNYAEAEKSFLKVREIDPKDMNGLTSLGNFYIVTKNPVKAEAIFKEALALYPKAPNVFGNLAELYFQLGRFDDAANLLKSTQALMPADPVPSFLLANQYTRRNQPAEVRKVLLDLKSKKEFADNLDIAKRLAENFLIDDPTRASIEIDQVLKAKPKDPVGLLLKGRLQIQLGEFDKAKETLSEPQAINSGQPEVFYWLGFLEAKVNNLDRAIEHYQKAINLNPNYLVGRIALASALIDRGKPADARVEIEKVNAVARNNIAARMVTAALDRVEKKYAESERELNALLKEQPDNADVHLQMARTQLAMGKVADAEKSALRAVELDPNSFSRVDQLTRFYIETRQPEKAVQKVSAIADQQQKAPYYELLGGIYAGMGKVPDAELNYRKALEKDPKSVSPVAALAALYIQAGRLPEALQKLNEVIEKSPTNANAYATRGMVLESQGKPEDAKTSYRRALELDPNSDVAANNLAYMLAEEGKELEAALGWAQGVKRRHPDSPAIADTLGWVYYKFGNYALARDQMQFALSKDPENPTFQYHLGMVYKALKQTREAAEALRKASNNPKDFKEKALAQAALKEVAP